MPNMQQTLEQDNLVTITIHTKRRDAEEVKRIHEYLGEP